MERHDCFVLVTTATCAALGVASFVIMLGLSRTATEIFEVVTASVGVQMMWCLVAVPIHIWMWRPPQALFADYSVVVIHWMMTVGSLVLASVGVGLVYSQHGGRSSCGGRCELSSWLAFAMAALSVVDALLLLWAARRTHCAAAIAG